MSKCQCFRLRCKGWVWVNWDMGRNYCVVKDCTSTDIEFSLFGFPKNCSPEWIQFTWYPTLAVPYEIKPCIMTINVLHGTGYLELGCTVRDVQSSLYICKSVVHTHKYTIIYEPIIQIIYTNCIWIRTPHIGPGVNRSKGPSTGSQEKITYRQKPSSGLQERIKLKSVLSSFVEFCENWQ